NRKAAQFSQLLDTHGVFAEIQMNEGTKFILLKNGGTSKSDNAAWRAMQKIIGLLKQYADLFFKFGVVGAGGTLINLAIFWLLREALHVDLNLSSAAAFGVAVSSNYFLNQNWTFRKEATGGIFHLTSYLRYVAVNLLGLGINLLVLNGVVWLWH